MEGKRDRQREKRAYIYILLRLRACVRFPCDYARDGVVRLCELVFSLSPPTQRRLRCGRALMSVNVRWTALDCVGLRWLATACDAISRNIAKKRSHAPSCAYVPFARGCKDIAKCSPVLIAV